MQPSCRWAAHTLENQSRQPADLERYRAKPMQHVSSLGGPRVLLPTQDVPRWIGELGNEPTPDAGLYALACSVDDYCGIIQPWGTPIIVFGDDPSDMYWSPDKDGGLFVRWVGAGSLEQLIAFAKAVSELDDWAERIEWDAQSTDYTLMDTCTFVGDTAPRVAITLPSGRYIIKSKYAESDSVMTIVQRLEYAR